MSYYYYEVLDSNSNRICMCGSEADARMMISLGENRMWVKRQFLAPDTVTTTAEAVEEGQLPQRLDLPAGESQPLNL